MKTKIYFGYAQIGNAFNASFKGRSIKNVKSQIIEWINSIGKHGVECKYHVWYKNETGHSIVVFEKCEQ